MKRHYLVPAALLLIGLLLLLSLAPQPAYAATFTVTNASDINDSNPGDGICSDGVGGCSLRAAVQEANALGGAHSIVLANGGTYSLDISGSGEDSAVNGDLDITAEITISVAGAGSAVIQGGINATDRLFDVRPGGQLYLTGDITLQNSNQLNGLLNGGGIYINAGGVLNANGVTIQGNRSVNGTAHGGGVFNAGVATFTGSIISGNVASGTTSQGCGIYNDASGSLTLTSTVVRMHTGCTSGAGLYNLGTLILNAGTLIGGASTNGNIASAEGGGIYNGISGVATINNATAEGNSANNGGGIYNIGTLTLNDGTLISNIANNQGGGLWNNNSATLNYSTVGASGTPNTANSGGGIWAQGGTTQVEGGFVSHNIASGTGGGGMYINGDTINLIGANVTYNVASTGDGGNIYQAGGLTTASSGFHITDGYAISTGGEGGGLYLTGGTFNGSSGYIKDNYADVGGGAAVVPGTGPALNLMQVRMYRNEATTNGGSIYLLGGTLSFNRGAITDSIADNGAAIFQAGGSANLINSTLSGNDANDYGGGLYLDAAGIGLINVTIYDNSAPSGGSGLYEFSTSSISVINTIIGGNTGTADCTVSTMTSLGHNLFVSGGGCTSIATDQIAANAGALLLGPLSADVHTPQDGSPALDNADGATCISPAVTNSIDQPGNARTTTCDIGAVEASYIPAVDTPTPIPPTSAAVVVPTETASPTPVTPTATRIVILRGTATPRPTLTTAPTNTGEPPTEAPTEEPTAVAEADAEAGAEAGAEAAFTPTPQPVAAAAQGCVLVEPESMNDLMLVSYGEAVGEEDPLNWIICPEPPGQTCFGIDRPLPDDLQARLRSARSYDCTEDGICTEYRFEEGTEGTTVCLVPVESGISPDTAACTDGCAIALGSKIKPGQVAVFACLPALIIAALVALVFFRRRTQEEEERTVDQELAGG